MSKEDKPPPSPNHGLFDPTSHLLGAPSLGLGALPFPHLAHLPAFPWLARPPFPPALFGGLGLSNPLLAHGLPPTTGDFAALFGMSKHLSELPSTSASSPSPSKRSRTPTPAPPAHQKTSTSKSSLTSSSSTKSAMSKDHGYPSLSADTKGNWHVNGSAFSLKSLASSDKSSSRKHRHKAGKTTANAVSSSVYPPPFSSVATVSSSVVANARDGEVALNLSKPSVSCAASSSLSSVTPGVQDLSMKKPPSQSKATNGTRITDSDSPDVSSPGSEISDDSDNGNTSDMEKGEKSGERRSSHQIDGSKRQLLADQIRQQLMSGTSSSSPLATPLVIPSLRLRHGKEDQKKFSHNTRFPLLNLPHDYPHPEAFFTERDLLGLPASSSSHDASPHSAALSYLSGELRLNHQSKDDSQDSLHSYQQSEAEDSKLGTSGSERPMDSESQSGWGSEDDGSHRAGSSASPGPSYRGQGDGDDPSKKRNIVLNERELLIPLEHGWRRQTTIHGMGRRGIVGEVIYYAPCTKKMKTIPDVMRYLDRHGITDLSRENFTFNTKVNVGQFFEVRDNKVVPLTEVEILERIAMSKGKRARMQMLARKKCEKQLRQQTLAKQVMEAKLKRRQEQQEMARKAAEMKFQMRLEKEQQRELAKKVREVRLMERQREKEQARIMKQQEKARQQEQLRLEREMRAQQIIEARRRRQQELEEIRMKEIIRKNKSNLLWLQMEREREMKKQQQLMEKEQERERRRQHLLLVKALEQRKKQEEKQEKERLREEKIREKNIERERKMAQRQVEMLIAREMKKPMDDMELRDGKPLPEFPRCPEVKLPGPAFSDCLMIVEFVHNFADALGLDADSVPSLEVLQNGLLNANDEDVEEMVTLYLHLLRFALDDLGVPNPKEAMTMLNQKITDLEINDATMSEVTRIFLSVHGEKKMSDWLENTPLEALNPTKKAAIIAFLCNELLSSKRILGEIEKTLETINTLRRDKWVAEGKLRKLRTVRARKYLKIEHLHPQPPPPSTDEDSMTNTMMSSTTVASSKAASDEEEEKDEEDEEEEVESCDESDAAHTMGNRSEDEDEGLSKEEMDKKIDKLVKQHNSYDSKVADVSKHLRGTCLGQDRYKRFYWILPATGGIFVEGIESGEMEALVYEAELLAKQKAKKEEDTKKEEEVKKEKEETVVKSETTDCESVKKESSEEGGNSSEKVDEEKTVEVKMEAMEVKSLTEEAAEVKAVKEESVDTGAVKTEDSKLTSGSASVGSVCVKEEQSKEVGPNGCVSVTLASDTVSDKTQATGEDAACTPTIPSQAAQLAQVDKDAEKTDSAKSGVRTSSHSSLLFQEPILSKLSGLLKLPQTDVGVQRSQLTASLPSSSSASLSVISEMTSTTAASTSVAASSSVPVPVISTTSTPKVAQTISSTATTVLSSTPLSSLPSPAVTTTPELKPSTPPPTTTHISLVPSSVVSSSNTSPASSSASQGSSQPCLSVSHLSPSVSQEMCVTPELMTPVIVKSDSISPTTRKTLSFTSTTILSSTPLSMLSQDSPTTSAASPASTSAVTSVIVSTPVVTNVASSELEQETVLASTPITSTTSLSSHVVSLLNSSPITSPIPSVSSPVKGDKKSNFISIDALLKKEPGTDSPISMSAATTGASPSPVKNHMSTNNHFLPPSLFPPSPLVSEYFLKSYADILDQKPWFSILPRLPCDAFSLSQPPHKTDGSTSTPSRISMVSADNIASASLSLLSLLPMHALHQAQAQAAASQASTSQLQTQSQSQTQTPSQSFADFTSSFQAHLSQTSMAESSVSISIATNTSDISTCMDSFKVPAPPSDSMFGELFVEIDPTAVLQKFQGEPLPVPISKQRGWWKISDIEQVRQLYNCLLSRGVREKNMAYSLRKYMELCEQICTQDSGKTKVVKTEVKEETPENSQKTTENDKQAESNNPAETNMDKTEVKVKEEKMDVSKEESKTEEPMEVATEDVDDAIPADPEDSWSVKAGFEVEMACLEDVEALEDRIFNASLQVKAWKLPQRATEDPEIRMVDRSVENPTPPECYPMDVARNRLLLLESNIERRYLKPPLMRNVQLNLVNIASTPDTKSDRSGGDSKADKSADGSNEGEDETDTSHEEVAEQNEDVPPGLMLWRRAVHTAQTPAQLNLCTQLLGSSIAWEKSIMKVTCQICLKDDNEAELLLCDGCDKGYHTYCFKPKMETIPDGDWYCYECVTKASGVAHCIVCGQKGGKMVVCERCPRAVHTDCLDPPLPRMPKKWQCASCITSKSKKSSKRKRKEAPAPTAAPSGGRERKDSITGSTKERKDAESATDTPPPEKKKKESAKDKKGKAKEEKKKEEKPEKKNSERKEKKEASEKKKTNKKKKGEASANDPKTTDNDLAVCGKLVTELEKSEDGWPFLKPVSTKQFPSYKKIIPQPMDFHTMKGKLRDKTYRHRSEFAADVHLILDNCETFNEDDSEVGQAGHSLRKFFRQRWRELFSEDS